MADQYFKIKRGITVIPQSSPTLTDEGDIAIDSVTKKIKTRLDNITDNIVHENRTASMKNKTLEDASTVFADSTDPTKQVQIDVAGTTGTKTTIVSSQTTNKTLTLPDATDTLVGKATTDILSNKSISLSNNNEINVGAGGRVLVSNEFTGMLEESDITSTELNKLDGIAADATIQQQLNDKASASDLSDHIGFTTGVHGSTSNSTASTIVERDASSNIKANAVVVATGGSGGLDVAAAGDLSIGATVGNNTITLGSSDSEVVIPGDLRIEGIATAVDTDNLNVKDKNITVNSGGDDASAAGAGLSVEGTGASVLATVLYDSALESKFKAGVSGSESEVITANASQSVRNKNFLDAAIFDEITTPLTPASNKQKFYAKADGYFYQMGDNGIEKRIGGGAGGYYKNYAVNGDLELGTTDGFTASAGTLAVTSTSSNVYAGNYALSWTPAAASDTLSNDGYTIVAGGGPVGNAAVVIKYKTSSVLHKLQVLHGATVIQEYTLPASASEYTKATLYSTFPASGLVTFRILAGDTNAIILDDMYMGDAREAGAVDVANEPQYDQTEVSVTGTGWTTTRAVFIPYQTSNGVWRLRFNVSGLDSTSNVDLTIAGVTFRTLANYYQGVTASFDGIYSGRAFVINGTSTLRVQGGYAGTPTTFAAAYLSGDVELDSKPTWATRTGMRQAVAPDNVDFEWRSYTPTSSWTNTTFTGRYRRQGENMEVYVSGVVLAGGPPSTSLIVDIPAGYTIDTTKLPNTTSGASTVLGNANARDAGTADYIGAVRYLDTNSVNIQGSGTADVWSDARPFGWVGNDSFSLHFTVPIVGWTNAQPTPVFTELQTVAARYTVTSGTANTSITHNAFEVIDFNNKIFDTHNAVTTGAGWKFTAPIAGYYNVSSSLYWASPSNLANTEISIYKNGVDYTTTIATGNNARGVTGTALVQLNAGDYVDVRVIQSDSGSAARDIYTPSPLTHVSIHRIIGTI